ncbi:MAG: CSLREA domain-containing protein, partial [Xanthomonadales bacterium]|nr:CSLREA domain-containing protein [Xanthomonadales bacterium]
MTLRRKRRHLAPPMSALLICLVGVSYAHADVTFNVNTTADLLDQDTGDGVCLTASGQCSLRAAIMQANHLIGPIATHIRLPAGNYMLTRLASGSNGEDSGDLNFTAPLS